MRNKLFGFYLPPQISMHSPRRYTHLLFILTALLLFSQQTIAQINQDASLWLTASAEKKLNKNHDLFGKAQIRLTDNFSSFNYSRLDIGLSTRVTKSIRFDIAYVFNSRRNYVSEDFNYYLVHKFYANLSLKYQVSKFRLSNRSRVQTDMDEESFTPTKKDLDFFYRNKTTVKLKTSKKIEPYLSYEWYIRLNNKKDWEDYIYRQRFATGLEYSISKRKKIVGYYQFQHQLKKGAPNHLHVFGIEYEYTFKKNKKKDTPVEAE